MTSDTLRPVMDELNTVLETERAALLAGNLDKVNRLYPGKERLVGLLNEAGGTEARRPGQLDELHRKLSRNQTLLSSAIEGVRAIALRMTELRQVQSGLLTYDRHGLRKKHPSQARPSFEKRA